MVSIPDWSRFRRGPPPPPSPLGNKRAMTPRERYVRAMEREAISEATQKGYFLDPIKDDIIDWFGETHGAEDPFSGLPMQKQQWHVQHIRLSYQHMKVLGDVPLFSRITILILDHNYLSNIDPLVTCRELIKLDIHSNQVPFLPDAMFWSQFQRLKILLAHDNPIGRVETIHSLNTCRNLQILTLYDSPLSLKKNYRHHVVNTVWSLKALDRHVISDEEIIEDAVFKGTRFSSLQRQFEVELCPSQPKIGATFNQEMKSVRNVLTQVNQIMARYSPVLIIQKMVRCWLTLRCYRLYVDSRAWAATTIQRAWRDYKKLPEPIDIQKQLYGSIDDMWRASPEPYQDVHQAKFKKMTVDRDKRNHQRRSSQRISSSSFTSKQNISYNSAINMLRSKKSKTQHKEDDVQVQPGGTTGFGHSTSTFHTESHRLITPYASIPSKPSSKIVTSSLKHHKSRTAYRISLQQSPPSSHSYRQPASSSVSRSVTPTGSVRKGKTPRRALIIDLTKLTEENVFKGDALDENRVMQQVHMMTPGRSPTRRFRFIKKRKTRPRKRRVMTVRHFFGPVVEDSLPVNHRQCAYPPGVVPGESDSVPPAGGYSALYQQGKSALVDTGEEVPRIAYRLRGQRKGITLNDVFEETILSKQEIGQDIRDMETAVHDKLASQPKRQRVKKEANIKDKFMYQRMQQTMALSCLTAVQQAYRDRELDERKAANIQTILEMKEKREAAKESIKMFHEEKRTMALSSRQEDRRMLVDYFDSKEKQVVREFDKSLTLREKAKRDRKHWKAEQNFALEFRTQQTSVSKALTRHDRQSRKDQQYQRKVERVENLKDMEREQQDIVKKYLQHRQMLRQTENSMSRAALDTKMLQEANDRILEAKSRIDQQKSRSSRAQQYVTVPATAANGPNNAVSAELADDITSARNATSKSALELTLPSPSRAGRPDTRLALSGGNMRLVEIYNKLSFA